MTTDLSSPMMQTMAPSKSHTDDTDDLMSGPTGSAQPRPPSGGTGGLVAPGLTSGESAMATAEVAGDAVAITSGESTAQAGAHDEVGSPEGAEAGEEFLEASPTQLYGEAGGESAFEDLRGIEGFEEPMAGAESDPLQQPALLDAGDMQRVEAEPEFLGALLGAVVPTLVSTVGPAIGKAVMGRLKPRTRKHVRRIAKGGAAVAAAAAKGSRKNRILALIAKLLESAEAAPGGESMGNVDPAIVDETAAVLEIIIGTDDRVRITPTTRVPWRWTCALRIQFPSGSTFRGTGFLIGPRALATAGHCVYMHDHGGWARKIEVIPAADGSLKPYGMATATSLRSVGGWVNQRRPESDYGCIVLPNGSFGGRNLGSFGFAAFPATTILAQPAVVAGYPGDKPFAELWGMARRVKAVTSRTLVYDTDTMGGQSGAPVYIKRNGNRYVVGIHNYGAANGNMATRVTQPVYQRLLGWSKL